MAICGNVGSSDFYLIPQQVMRPLAEIELDEIEVFKYTNLINEKLHL